MEANPGRHGPLNDTAEFLNRPTAFEKTASASAAISAGGAAAAAASSFFAASAASAAAAQGKGKGEGGQGEGGQGRGHVVVAPAMLLGATDNRAGVPFYQTKLSRGGTGDSMFKERSNFYADPSVFDVVSYPMRSLDSLAQEDPLVFGAPDFIKLDVQGAELEVLRGAESILGPSGSANFVLLEAPLRAFNTGAPSLADYLTFMQQRGFAVVDVYEVHHLEKAGTAVVHHPTALQVDLLFARNGLKAFEEEDKASFEFETGL